MGNTPSNTGYRTQEEQITHIDGGSLTLESGLAIYTSPQDWKKSVVRALQLARKLAPYYKGLDDYDESWSDEKLLSVLRKALPPTAYNQALLTSVHDPSGAGPSTRSLQPSLTVSPSRPSSYVEANNGQSPTTNRPQRPRAVTVDSSSTVHQLQKTPRVPFGILLYKHAVECPICFLYYPVNIATTRCCRQPICTECFVQIRRPNPHAPVVHADDPQPPPENPETLIMESPVCPYCNVSDFGVIYPQPDVRYDRPAFQPFAASERDVPASASEVVLTDMIRPDWTAKLQRAKDRAARRAANAALLTAHLQRQERRAQAEAAMLLLAGATIRPGEEGGSEGRREARRLRRREVAAIEDQQLAEAIRLSMLEDEARQQREQQNKGKVATTGVQEPGEASAPDESRISERATTKAVSVAEGGSSSRRTSGTRVQAEVPSASCGGHSLPMQELLYAPPPDSFVPAGRLQEEREEEEIVMPARRSTQERTEEEDLETLMKAMQTSPRMQSQCAHPVDGRQ
ncbi:hypothetical protein BCR37DRAFT_378114 [Protomyces lactucae-debilis]|uniref:RING-type domain-containing protein n=1 Tax=Protomyces lactucae-debilis TaxID=2754530 RepID=A0A1Y2FM66_PROLT|nr:uncharacterized protein BCR37DRAFT_378114 [Protomyces lactucae-debilis]ORY85072.1 hypothetical protein BCR37DRAFT_378114 [Protomyces lactucae-debilis]